MFFAEEEDKKKSLFDEAEFKRERLEKETFMKALRNIREDHPDEYTRLKEEMEHLFSESRESLKRKQEIETLEAINKKNKLQFKQLLEKTKMIEKDSKLAVERLNKKIEEEKNFAISKFASESLEIMDNFERSFESLEKDQSETGNLIRNSEFFEGINILYSSAE